jgi:hypothetical protein
MTIDVSYWIYYIRSFAHHQRQSHQNSRYSEFSQSHSTCMLLRCHMYLQSIRIFLFNSQSLLQHLNVFTSQGYINSAKRADFPILYDSQKSIQFEHFFCIAIIVCIDILIVLWVVILINLMPGGVALVFYIVIIVFLFSALIITTFITTLMKWLSAIFMFYCMNKKFTEYSFKQLNHHEEIKDLLNQIQYQDMRCIPNITSETFDMQP